MAAPPPDIDPALAAQLAHARPGDRIEALILLKGEARARLGGFASSAAAAPEMPEIVRAALGARAPAAVEVRVFGSLGALYVAGPAEVIRSLLADPDVVSATLPDRTE
jgi:hypothetical protein